jgi:hypothetical protein
MSESVLRTMFQCSRSEPEITVRGKSFPPRHLSSISLGAMNYLLLYLHRIIPIKVSEESKTLNEEEDEL